MNSDLKRNLRILSDHFDWRLSFQGNDLHLERGDLVIQLKEKRPSHIDLSYMNSAGEHFLNIPGADVYDIILQLFHATTEGVLERRTAKVLEVADWLNEEGDFFLDKLKQLVLDSPQGYHHLGGNRILAEYLNGILILTDDLNYFKSNVLSVQNMKELEHLITTYE